MKKNVAGFKNRGLALKIVFILVSFSFLGIALFIRLNLSEKMIISDEINETLLPETSISPVTSLANPASTNCITQGGNVRIESKPDGSQYGVCYFDDNRQCEEWAMMRGNCPVGGKKITGYATPAAVFCVISGGEYTITKESLEVLSEDEAGTCTFKSGAVCDVWKFYDGSCSNS